MHSSRNDPFLGFTGGFANGYCLPNLTGATAALHPLHCNKYWTTHVRTATCPPEPENKRAAHDWLDLPQQQFSAATRSATGSPGEPEVSATTPKTPEANPETPENPESHENPEPPEASAAEPKAPRRGRARRRPCHPQRCVRRGGHRG